MSNSADVVLVFRSIPLWEVTLKAVCDEFDELRQIGSTLPTCVDTFSTALSKLTGIMKVTSLFFTPNCVVFGATWLHLKESLDRKPLQIDDFRLSNKCFGDDGGVLRYQQYKNCTKIRRPHPHLASFFFLSGTNIELPPPLLKFKSKISKNANGTTA